MWLLNMFEIKSLEEIVMQNLESWNEAYLTGEYQQHWGVPYPSPELVAFIAANDFASGATALDVGCGAGQESIFLAEQGFSVIGIDQSEEALKIATEKAKQAGVKVDWKQGNILELPIADQSIELINDRGCFHVITDENRSKYASEMARVLKPGGKILLRGCRELDTGTFTAVTAEAIDKYFSADFICKALLPIEIVKGSGGDLKANLVVLIRK